MIARILLLAVLAPLPLFAQHGESVTVEVVEVPVYVHRGFQPVEGLTRENFELLVEGKPQPIDYFDVVDMGAGPAVHAEAGGAQVPDLRQRRLFLLLFDQFHGRPHAIARSRRAALDFVEKGAPGDSFGVAILSSSGRFEFVTPFTRDRQAIVAAIGNVRGQTAQHPMRTMITQGAGGAPWTALVEGLPVMDGASGGASRGGGRGAAVELEDPETGGGPAMDDARSRPLEKLQEDLLLDFIDASRRLSQLEGHKHVVLFSEGFALRYRNSYAMEVLYKMFDSFQEANTFLHTIDVAGLRHTFDPMDNAALYTLAAGTGGTFLHNSNNLGELLQEMSEQHRYVYVLGFRPRAPRRGHNDIQVRLVNVEPRAVLSYRRGFSSVQAPRTLDGLRLADIILNDVPQSGVRATVSVTQTGLRIVVPAEASATVGGQGPVDVMFYVFDAKNAIVEGRQFRLDLTGRSRTIDAKIPFRSGSYTAKVLLRAGESVGLTTTTFEVR